MSFQLPPGLPNGFARELQLACLAGGFDNAPGPTRTQIHGDRLVTQRAADESGFLITPWHIDGGGRLMASTATLIEREELYSLAVELARGKINQIRCNLAEWREDGMNLSPELVAGLEDLNRQFGQVLAAHPSAEADALAKSTLQSAFRFTERLLPHYAAESLRRRQERFGRLEATSACRLTRLPENVEPLAAPFNQMRVGLSWRSIEPTESQYNWVDADACLDWAEARGLSVAAGPLIDFSAAGIPDWLWIWEGDLSNLANFMCDYVETVIARYRRRINRWFLATGCNMAGVLGLSEDDLLWLTARLSEAALQISPGMELVLGVSQPWADYMAREEHTYTPLVFLDTLLRTGLKISAIDLELAFGFAPRGSYCRDLLEVSRLLDAYAVLSAPVQVTLAVPSSAAADSLADPTLSVGAGSWVGGYSPETQARQGADLTALALAKPFVTGVCWAHASDAAPHHYPNAGVLDSLEQPKPIVDALQHLRQQYLR